MYLPVFILQCTTCILKLNRFKWTQHQIPKKILIFFPPQIYKRCLVLFTATFITFRKRALYRTALNEQISPYQVNMLLEKPPFKQHWPPRRSCITHQAGSWHLEIIFFNYFAALSSNCQPFLSSASGCIMTPFPKTPQGDAQEIW